MSDVSEAPIAIPTFGSITCKMTGFHITKWGKKVFGLPIEPRKSKGFRKHVRRQKAQCA